MRDCCRDAGAGLLLEGRQTPASALLRLILALPDLQSA